MTRSEAGFLGAIKTHQLWQKRYDENPKFCFGCKEKLTYQKRKNKFCDNSCAASFNNVGIQRNLIDGTYGKKDCLYCSKKTNNVKFCSAQCCKKYQWKEIKFSIETSGKAKFKRTAKRYIIETFGNKCAVCDISMWQGTELVLILDHINGNSDDWSLINLRLLCPNCDSLTSTYKGRNLGNGRFSRRQRYKDGKSY